MGGGAATNYTVGRNQTEARRVSAITVLLVARSYIAGPIFHGARARDYAVGSAPGQRELPVAAGRLGPRAPPGGRRSGARCQFPAPAPPDPLSRDHPHAPPPLDP